jgi:SAM-dependent methyltransferase
MSLLKRIADRLAAPAPAPAAGAAPATPARAPILDAYVRKAPDPQSAVDLFKGDWWSCFPGEMSRLQAGTYPLFVDDRITWAIDALGGVAGKSVLELGPMEGGHTYILEKAGASQVTSIEANSRCYMKCLITKEVMGLRNSRFLLGDFEEYLRQTNDRYDAAIACGVLYHMRNPVELLQNLARVSDRVFVWTQYYLAEQLAKIPHMKNRFPGSQPAEHGGFKHTQHRYEYGDFLDTTRFSGGSETYSHWLSREDLFGALKHAGLSDIVVYKEEVEHTNGPSISLLARRP